RSPTGRPVPQQGRPGRAVRGRPDGGRTADVAAWDAGLVGNGGRRRLRLHSGAVGKKGTGTFSSPFSSVGCTSEVGIQLRAQDGYTLKRGVGKGGFGEVYFGVSDGGKEVALKLLQGNAAVELRGVAQCLNLKHPNLVDLYDLKTDASGDPWVIMEYVGGETLNVVLCRHPNGLDRNLAGQWFLALAAGVGHLHDHGIVHRDLKPGNIFLEDGRLKVGDYGLCKFIGGADATRQSQSVGT